MFDDFSKTKDRASNKRMRRSLAAAAVVYGSSFGVVVAATATARHVVEEELTQVAFAPPPEPEPPPPPEPEAPAPKPQVSHRPKARRPELAPPKEISNEKPKESDAPLAEATGEPGPVDGFLDGVEGGTGTAPAPPPPPPPPKPEPLTLPVVIKDDQPKYPKGALRKGIEGSVVVAFDVLENGSVANPKIISGPEELHEAVLETALTWRYKPAKLGGKPVRHRMTKRVTFRLEDA